MGNTMTDDAMNIDMTIDDQGLEEQVDSLGITKYEVVDPHNALFVTKKGTDAQTVRTRTELTSNFVHTVE